MYLATNWRENNILKDTPRSSMLEADREEKVQRQYETWIKAECARERKKKCNCM